MQWNYLCQIKSKKFFLTWKTRLSGSFQAGIFPEPGPGFEWGTVTKWCDVTHSSHFDTFQVRCDAARFRNFFFSTSKNLKIFWNLVQMWRFRHIVTSFSWVQLGTKHSFQTWPGSKSGFWVPGFPISAWNDPETKSVRSSPSTESSCNPKKIKKL